MDAEKRKNAIVLVEGSGRWEDACPGSRDKILTGLDKIKIMDIQRSLSRNEIGETLAPLLNGFTEDEYKELKRMLKS